MSTALKRLTVSLEQFVHMIRAFADLQRSILPENPTLFRLLSESPLDMMSRMLSEVEQYVEELALHELQDSIEQMKRSLAELDRLHESVTTDTQGTSYAIKFDGPLNEIERLRRDMLDCVNKAAREHVVS